MTKLTLLFLVAAFVATLTPSTFAHPVKKNPDFNLVGYATQNGGTTGGKGGPVVKVSTIAAFTKAVKDDSPRIVKVTGILKLSGQIDVGSHKTILGANSNSGFTGGGLRVKDSTNVVIRNLKISLSKGTDSISLLRSTNVWIDHNEFWSEKSHGKDYYDGLIDITHASDWVTVSWNKFHDHWKATLVGHTDSNSKEDTGTLHVTYHHNHFYDVFSRTPSVRFGTSHIYNNFFENIDSSVHSRMDAQVLVEGNVWRNVSTPITTHGDSKKDGGAVIRNNDYGGAKPDITKICPFTKASYGVSLDVLDDVASIVANGAGVGVIPV